MSSQGMIARLIPAAVERVKQHFTSSSGRPLDDAVLRFACTVGALEALAAYSKVDLVEEPPVPPPTELPPPNVSALKTSDDRNQFERLTAIVEENRKRAPEPSCSPSDDVIADDVWSGGSVGGRRGRGVLPGGRCG